ncbi:SAM-dependent methyltransferase [Paenibacillus sp. 32O-W]|uniref:rRNA methyltransferase n=1 Tax=Paenibacillus cisolokensis TaxID=1658519 RepID=A0ABQ4NDE4_9BACL|nr:MULTISPECIES: class I SAM-dependent methyltransferase [Paenibacillus]ALS29420.1 SAM-dependent methyltransferase [Paenibacillus sp. 32O-W]GIQ66253.1 rRNA methyltransferase [Paenibacillus cisolokensis]
MGLLSVLSMAHRWIAERVAPGDTVIDATAGNGVDTLFLAETVGPRGTVIAFDVQRQALDRTQARLEPLRAAGRLPDVRLVLGSHAGMEDEVPAAKRGRVAAVMFNLGYLPGADPSVITETASTLAALEASMTLLRPGGIVTCVLYPGHEGGETEAAAVEAWAAGLPPDRGQSAIYRHIQKPAAPYLIAVEKRKPRPADPEAPLPVRQS